ncbi:SDR family NAD(P)-dependent oxidoreductase [Cucumibacter marinus]|uniref:SDR family NAD(P)-dependent oxidoreductase n=1 Tax=Cucumibacter marinus TaxID=1121252 RepID=UPI00041F0C31|nr:SDR family oxidoreductase [Cucumibacter marinus]
MSEDFEGKTAVVTGSSGIGLGCALRLADLGAKVYLCGISAEYNEAARQSAAGMSLEVVEADVSDEAQVKALADRVARERGDLNTLVNAAAIQPYGTIETTAPADWDQVIKTNLRSCYLTAHLLYPLMKGRRDASIIHLASVQGHANQRNVLAYATTKGAIHALTRAMAVDCAADGVRVNSVSPGSIRTPLLEFAAQELTPPGGSIEETLKGFGAAHPVGRVGTVEEVADLVAYLAGGSAGFCTGSDFAIDGGLRAQLGV